MLIRRERVPHALRERLTTPSLHSARMAVAITVDVLDLESPRYGHDSPSPMQRTIESQTVPARRQSPLAADACQVCPRYLVGRRKRQGQRIEYSPGMMEGELNKNSQLNALLRKIAGVQDAGRPHHPEVPAFNEMERRILEQIKRREPVSRNVNDLQDEQLTVGQKLADRLADVAGSWGFIVSFLALCALWIFANAVLLVERAWDPYPFILLNLLLSLVAGIQGPVIMMSQNRQEAKDRLRAQHDYEVNLKAEIEIGQMHEKLDLFREKQWNDLVELQQQQIAMLEQQVTMLQELQGRRA